MAFRERLQNGLLIFDGALGTEIHKLELTDEQWMGRHGCSEVLNLTVPDMVKKIHAHYLDAGADVIETNTFGANRIVLEEYDLADRIEEINRTAAEIGRRAVDEHSSGRECFVCGSIGPGTRLPSLGQISFDDLYDSYYLQSKGLITGGVDVAIIETCQDILQAKSALLAFRDACRDLGKDLPVIVSITIETTGTMLLGTEVTAALAALEPLDIDVISINCATGPEAMAPYVKILTESFRGPVMVMPNAGLPVNVNGNIQYDMDPADFVKRMKNFITEDGVQVAGGCCGTTPEFIEILSKKTEGLKPAKRNPSWEPSISSIYSAQALAQDPRPLFIGERANTNGSRLFREYLLEGNWDGILNVAMEQEGSGAHALDLCVAYTGRDEAADMTEAVTRITRQVRLPLVVDSTTYETIESALKLNGGRVVINSINLEDGEEKAGQVCALAKRYGAALIALTIDEKGMARTAEQKVSIAERIYDIAVNRHGLRAEDLIFDPLTFTLGSGDEDSVNAGIETLKGVKLVKERLPGVYTMLGVSNISFGLNPVSRKILNSVFLHEAIEAGLDAAIVNVKQIVPLHKIDREDLDFALNLIYNRGENPLFAFMDHFEERTGDDSDEQDDDASLPLEERIKKRVINGNRVDMEELLMEKLDDTEAVDIINGILIPAMKVVGELFGSGQMQLPFVLQSAEVMRHAVHILEPYMEKTDEAVETSLVLATVRGDVHDIGKNLVDIILSNNGFRVYNLGIKCEIETMLNKVKEVNADAIGMSGLLVKSTAVMKENLEYMRDRGVNVPVLLGGAALTKSYVDDVCDPILEAPVVYCRDAFEGLTAMSRVKEGTLVNVRETVKVTRGAPLPLAVPEEEPEPISRDIGIPEPPFWGNRVVTNIDIEEAYPLLTKEVLFRGRWGFRRGRLSKQEYEKLIRDEAEKELERLKKMAKEENLLVPGCMYGYYPCHSSGDDVIIYKPDTLEPWKRLSFPRQKKPPRQCIADFFLPEERGRHDMIALQVVTVGARASEYSQELYRGDRYREYLLFHGFSVETAEALAELLHKRIREELGIAAEDGEGIEDFVVQKYRGSRYSFGYPACPDMTGNNVMLEILESHRVGVTVTEEGQMVPEQTTSAFIVHHPQAKYFTVE